METHPLKDDPISALLNGASFFQRLRARLLGPVSLGICRPHDFNASTEFFLFKCEKCHQLSADCLHTNDNLYCHLCN